MSILFIAPLPDPITGQSIACQVLLDELSKTHKVDIINMSKRREVGVDKFLLRIGEVLKYICLAWRKNKSASVIYFNISESFIGVIKDFFIYVACFARLEQMVVHLHGGAGMREIMYSGNPVLRGMNAFFLKRVGAIIVLGPSQIDIFCDRVLRKRIYAVPNFAQDDIFVTEELIRSKFVRNAPLRFLYLSNFLPGKGYEEFVAAIRALDVKLREHIIVDFAGGFQSEYDKEKFLCAINDIPQVHYHGVVQGQKKISLIGSSHVFCLPTYYPYEGQPISILEAYASGCAVITTDHSGIPDIFIHEVNGYCVEKRSVDSLKSAIESAISNPDRLLEFAMVNHATAMQHYRSERFCRQIIQIIECVKANGAVK